ncbi:MAG TPA: ACT domain-containing protein [Burkholderiales bacterium]|nr:ACT domain-containing protein [Burkholderiales bacterium]
MAIKATKAEVWVVTLEDRPGGAAAKLEALAGAGANLEMVLARRTETPGQGVMFVTPIKGAKAMKAAQEAGMAKPAHIHSVRIEGGDKPGLGAKIARALAQAGISFRGMSGVAIGRKFISYIALDSAEDQARAIAALKKLKA